jgi:hypothetical protein
MCVETYVLLFSFIFFKCVSSRKLRVKQAEISQLLRHNHKACSQTAANNTTFLRQGENYNLSKCKTKKRVSEKIY